MGTSTATRTAVNRTRVLIVEDEGIIARDIRRMLEDLGYEVTGTAASAAQAFESLISRPADLVLMDIRIRGPVDGIEAASSVKERFALPVIYLTAHTDTNTLDRAKASEPFGYIVKPFTTVDIKVAIEIGLQRYHRQKELEERDLWSNSVLRSIGEPIVITDSRNCVTYLNAVAEDMLGVPLSEAYGRLFDDVVRIERDTSDTLNCLDVDAGEGVLLSSGVLRRPDGTELLVVHSISPIRDGAGRHQEGSAILFRDVSDLRKAEQALRAKNSLLSRSNEHLAALSHSVAHDLKEPLRAVTCYSALLAESGASEMNAGQRQYLSYIMEGCARMDSLLTSLLEYYQAGILDAASAIPVDADKCLQGALLNLRRAIEETCTTITSTALPYVRAHDTALVQVFQNLIGNAVKYRSPDRQPIIHIEAVEDGDGYVFRITDNGQGFPQEQAERIFGLFKRAHGREISGSGIGLATCRRLITLYGGEIWAEANPGDGACFAFRLPAEIVEIEALQHK